MGKAWRVSGISGGVALTTFIAYTQTPIDAWYHLMFFIISLIAIICFGIAGIVYLVLLAHRRLQPLDILDDIRCTYWTKEKQMQVLLWICDYSNSPEFIVSCLAQFGSQIVNVDDKIQLDAYYMGNTYCRGGHKRMVEFRKNDVEVSDSSQCLVTISMKPLGMWATSVLTGVQVTLIWPPGF